MTIPCVAHISEDQQRVQTVLEHLEGTAGRAAAFADAFGASRQGAVAGMAHDIGKYSEDFQRRIHGANIRVDHATAGAFVCLRHRQLFASYAVMGHHGGLPDMGAQTDSADQPTYQGRIRRAREGKLCPYGAYEDEVTLPAASPPGHLPSDALGSAFFIRMLYSCLVDADFLDTAAFMRGRERERVCVTMDELIARLDAYCAPWFPPQTPLNALRCAILRQCESAGAAQSPGLFTLSIPTGGGKTVSSLAFALRHAKAHGMRRVIYVIPYTSIIEQNAAVFRKILGDECVLEHHSGVLCDAEGEATPEAIRKAEAVENWDAPVIVTTAVQFFESLFANRPAQCRKLHNIANSVVIFDEAQMLPLPYLRPCVHAIAQLVERFRVSAVLCTATQPALQGVFRDLCRHAPNDPRLQAREICPGIDFSAFKRVTFVHAGQLSSEELGRRLSRERQVLRVVNARQTAKDLFSRLPQEGSFHLSTLMTPVHRQATLEGIRKRLESGEPCRVVSTSLIEAGVDVDFPAVYREQAGLDAILQAAGRCNRNGTRPAEDAVVTIFRGEHPAPRLFAPAIAACNEALRHHAAPDSPEAIGHYFRELLSLNGKEAQDAKGILPRMAEFAFQAVAKDFHLIDSQTVTVYIPMADDAESAALIARLREGERSRDLFRRLGRYGVSVFRGPALNALLAAGDLEPVEEGCFLLTNTRLYDKDATGLSLAADDGKALFI